MKNLLFSFLLFAASCADSSGKKDVSDVAADQTKEISEPSLGQAVSIEQADKEINQNAVRTPPAPEKKESAKIADPHSSPVSDIETQPDPHLKDSTANQGEGGGSDIEGYIPFIKQFYDK